MSDQKPVTSSHLIDQISKNKSSFENLSITDDLEISGRINVMSLTFNNCKFHDRVRLSALELARGIEFTNCEFTNGVRIERTTLSLNDTQALIVFDECTTNLLIIHQVTAAELHITRSSIINATVDNSEIGTVMYKNGTTTNIHLSSIKARSLQIESVSILDELRINKNSIDSSLIFRTKVESGLYIKQLNTKGLSVLDCALNYTELINIFGDLSFIRNEFTHSGQIYDATDTLARENPSSIEFKGNIFKKAFKVGGNYLQFKNVTINCDDGLTGPLHFNQCHIDHLKITGTNTDGDILINHSAIHTLEFDNFTNLKSLSISDCDVSGSTAELAIVRSDLGKTKFLSHHFDYYHAILIEHSFLSEILVISCTWFTNNQLDVGNSENESARREIYRQLKHASEKQGDRIQGLLFQAEELKAFEEEIQYTTNRWSADRWILRLSRTNGYGLHWDRALAWLFVWTIPFFIVMAILATPELSWSPARSYEDLLWSIKVIWWDRLQILVQLFNPAHNPLAFVEKDISPLYFVFDGVHRIGAAFLIVQIVSAFRKFVRS